MEAKRRYTTMVFPQGFDGKKLLLNIVLIPRNQNPFTPYATGLPAPNQNAVPFADLVPSFEIKVVRGLDQWPISNATTPANLPVAIPATVTAATNKKTILNAMADSFGAKINVDNTKDKIETEEFQVSKYLPESYRKSFNFTTPRHPNAKTDDSYHCAIRKEVKKNQAWTNDNDLSWGQIFAHILRQPMLAKACGMIYSTSIDISLHPDWFSKGAYIYADITNADYAAIQALLPNEPAGPFIKRYAARLPKLIIDKPRPVFAPLHFPVLFRSGAVDPEPPKAPWDSIFAEVNEYNDGYAKIVHANQPVSSNLLSEAQDGAHPVNDAGIRLAWDDEQILIWYLRQLSFNPEEPGKRIDAPLGVYGYQIDVRKVGTTDWDSLNLVSTTKVYSIQTPGGAKPIGNGVGEVLALPYQVFPTQPDNDTKGSYWLPMYYTSWIGKSLVLKDTDAVKIYRNQEALDKGGGAKNVAAENTYAEVPAKATLRYGNDYEFQVRLMDISGGSPDRQKYPALNNAPSPTAKWPFRRYIAPSLCRLEKPADLMKGNTEFFNETIDDPNTNKRSFQANPVLKLSRPLLTYPAVVFTGKYPNPVDLLINAPQVETDKNGKKIIVPALADPDVNRVQIRVEVETLRLDNLLSKSGQENYITLYVTTRPFPADFNGQLSIPIQFKDVKSLDLGNENNPFRDPALNSAAINAMQALPLPTARKIRITLRGVCQDYPQEYYGFLNEGAPDLDSRYGKTTQLWFYKESGAEAELFLPKENVAPIKAVYLQPDPEPVTLEQDVKVYYNVEQAQNLPDIVQRLAQQLGVVAKGLTLVGKKGERVVFGCNNKIQHHLAPDQSSITFGTKDDLTNHWIGCLVYRLSRDWAWDALQNVSFTVMRNKKFKHDADAEKETVLVGDIELKRYASFESLLPDDYGNVNRDHTTLIFIDAIEPKSMLKKGDGQLRFPDELLVDYTITPNFKPGHGSKIELKPEGLTLPTTVNPTQVPKIVSVGIAFSPYRRNKKYSATEARQRYLWVELAEPVKDPHDALFCRMLKYAPDQLLSNNRDLPEEHTPDPPLPIDPEYTRSITPNQTDDMAGLGAMQPMEKASDADNIHYLMPLPPGLHAESPELFGFFTYEFRIGHTHRSNLSAGQDNLWSTAQGRFGRPLRITGMQHPAPTLLCNVNRDEEKLYVTAPYAKAVFKGRDVTADPPRTQLHCVLYAQVSQADGLEYRNILLQERLMILVKPIQEKPVKDLAWLTNVTRLPVSSTAAGAITEQAKADLILTHLATVNELSSLNLDQTTRTKVDSLVANRFAGKQASLDVEASRNVLLAFDQFKDKLANATPVATAVSFTQATLVEGAKLAIYKDQVKTAQCIWTNKEIDALLSAYGLPADSPLSVLTVEVFGNITNIFEHLGMTNEQVQQLTQKRPEILAAMQARKAASQSALTDNLGKYRILRTSPLTEVPFVCCTT